MQNEKPNLNNVEFEPLQDEKWYKERFYWLRDKHYDDLPEIDVRDMNIPYDDPRYNMFKCQGNYISGLKSDLQSALLDKIFDNHELKNEIKEFLNFKFGFSEGKFTTQEEIDKCNTMLNKLI